MMKQIWGFLFGSILVCLLSSPLIVRANIPFTQNDVYLAQTQSETSSAEETVNAIITKVSDRLARPDEPFILMVQLQAKPGFVDAVVASYGEQARQAASNSGSIVYELNQDTDDSTRFVLYERWINLDAFIAHETADFTLEHFERVAPMLEDSRQLNVLSPLITSETTRSIQIDLNHD